MNLKRVIAGVLTCVQFAMLLPTAAMAVNAAENYELGDPTGDSMADASDAANILEDAAAFGVSGTGLLTDAQRSAADTNMDGIVDASDAATILVYSALKGTGAVTESFPVYVEQQQGDVDVLSRPVMYVGKLDGAAKIRWDIVPYATGYEIYRYAGASTSGTNYQLVQTVQGGGTISYVDDLPDNGKYCYKIRAFRKQSSGTIYSDYSIARENWTKEAILQGADLEPHNTITVYNRQGAETTSYDVTLTDEDLAILEKFAVEHFPENCTREDQLWTTLQWIHKNVNYAYAGELWNSIAGMSWAEAVFENQKGQCVQYNGALASMMAYLGYDVCMVQGYRGNASGSYWQHFWPEVNIGGTTYMMECGNLGKSGDWYYFLCTYDQTSKYICNQKNMS